MKILDRYILTTYLKTFLSVFVILMLIFVLQAIWLYIGELAGKDLSISIIYKFLLYATPTLIPLILPLTILLASIMVFGNFAENYEFAAMKSTGISLQRAMRGLSIFIVLLGITTFFFSNNVIPAANFNFYNLRKNIAQKQPAMAIAEGQFNQLGDINIKVNEKSGDRGQYLKDVIIHKKHPKRTGNYTVISSTTGELKSSVNSNILQLVLYDGNYYDEVQSNDVRRNNKKPFVKSAFNEFTLNVDLEGIDDVDMEDKSYDNRYNMLDIYSLNYTIDSLRSNQAESQKLLTRSLYNRTTFTTLGVNIEPEKDSVFEGKILDAFDINTQLQMLNLASNTVNSTNQILKSKVKAISDDKKWLNKHVISLHEKYVLGFSCIILFFVGAPLGALIRKGGLGLPMVIAILLFLSYHFIGIFAKNSSEDGTLNPILATWLSTLIMLPLGIYLTSRATKDRGLFEFGSYSDPIKKFLGLRSSNKVRLADGTYKDYSYITDYSNDRLIEVIKNHEFLNLVRESKRIAYSTLISNGISTDVLKERGVSIHPEYLKSNVLGKRVINLSRITFYIFLVSTIMLILHFVFANNKFPQYANFSLIASIVGYGIYTIFFVVVIIQANKFYNTINVKVSPLKWYMMLLGFPLYLVTHFLVRNKLNDDLGQSALENIN